MTMNDAFEALANIMAVGDWPSGAKSLIDHHAIDPDKRAGYYKHLSDDDHTTAAALMLDEVERLSQPKRVLLHAGDDLPAHVIWIIETIRRLEQIDPKSADVTRQAIGRLVKKA